MRNKLQTILIGIGLLWGPILANSSTINTINVGSSANDGTGDTLRAAFQKVNSNDAALNADKVENSNGSASGLTLSGTTTIGGTLDVSSATTLTGLDSPDEIAEGLTRGEPSLWFDGSSDYVSVPDNAGLSFTDGTDDLPFSIVAWVKATDATSFNAVGKWGSGANREYQFSFNGSDKLQLLLQDSSSNQTYRVADTASTAYEGDWVFIAATYAGSGPNSSNAFSAAADAMTLYQNSGTAIASTATNNGSYAGMSDTSEGFRVGQTGGTYAEGEVRGVQLFNVALTAAQVEQIYRSGVPFELSQASATAAYTSDFTSDSVDSYSQNVNVTLDATLTVGSDSDNVAFSPTTDSSLHSYQKTVTTVPNKTYLYEIEYYCPSGQGIDGFRQYQRGGNDAIDSSVVTATTDAWTKYSVEFVATTTSNTLVTYLADSGGTTFTGVASDKFYIRNVVVKEIGAILDLNAADASGTNLADRSGNFNGTLNNMTLADNAVNLPAVVSSYHPNPSSGEALLTLGNGGSGADFAITEDWSGEWSPAIEFGNATAGITYAARDGYFSKVGNVVTAAFYIVLSAKGSSTGAAKITGLPYTSKTGQRQGGVVTQASTMSGLTSPITCAVDSAGTEINLFDWGATGVAALTEGNFNNTTDIRGIITYLID